MRHRNKGTILDRKKGPREAMLKNLVSSVLIYEKVKTTKAKAKAVKPLVEKLISTARANDLTARRKLIKALPQPMAIKKAMEVLGARYKDRKGGYTRIVKIGRRQGDGAEMAQIELV
ncbi:MAG: 50S ribosomal protein L17 [Patescibacteria group bacterium]|nr:50S ribosomal protein L17 [Patescibacteria group bacterium]